MRPLVILDESAIREMLNNASFLAQIPCLPSAAEKLKKNNKPGCGRCRKDQRATEKTIFDTVKNCLRELSSEKKVALKKLLDTKQYRLIIKKAGGGLLKLTV